MRLIPQELSQQCIVKQRVVVFVLQVMNEMVKVDQIILGAFGFDVSAATQRLVPTIRTVQKIVEVLLQLQSVIER